MASSEEARAPPHAEAAALALADALRTLREALQPLLSLVPPSFTAALPYCVVLFVALWLLRRVRCCRRPPFELPPSETSPSSPADHPAPTRQGDGAAQGAYRITASLRLPLLRQLPPRRCLAAPPRPRLPSRRATSTTAEQTSVSLRACFLPSLWPAPPLTPFPSPASRPAAWSGWPRWSAPPGRACWSPASQNRCARTCRRRWTRCAPPVWLPSRLLSGTEARRRLSLLALLLTRPLFSLSASRTEEPEICGEGHSARVHVRVRLPPPAPPRPLPPRPSHNHRSADALLPPLN